MRTPRWLLLLGLLAASTALAANVRLYMTDGEYHLVREYQVTEDRVRYYSVERGDWEEIPLSLVDLKKTEAEIKERQAKVEEESKLLTAEDKADREREAEIARVPQEAGVYLIERATLKLLKPAESTVHNNKRRSVLKVISPIPLISGKATVEINDEKSKERVIAERPEFYIRLSTDQRFGIIKLTPQKGIRVVENVTKVPVSEEIVEEMIEVEVFRQQVDEGLYKIWPQKPLPAGEYAVVEYTQGKLNMQVWDFGKN